MDRPRNVEFNPHFHECCRDIDISLDKFEPNPSLQGNQSIDDRIEDGDNRICGAILVNSCIYVPTLDEAHSLVERLNEDTM